MGCVWHGDLATKNTACGDFMTVDSLCGVVIAANASTVQRDSGKQASGARVGKDLGLKLPVGVGGGMTAYGAGGCRSVCAKLEFAADQPLHAACRPE